MAFAPSKIKVPLKPLSPWKKPSEVQPSTFILRQIMPTSHAQDESGIFIDSPVIRENAQEASENKGTPARYIVKGKKKKRENSRYQRNPVVKQKQNKESK